MNSNRHGVALADVPSESSGEILLNPGPGHIMGDKDMCFYMSIIKDKESLSVATTTTAFRDHTTLNLEHQDTVPTSDDDQSSDHYDDSSLEKRQGTVPPREEYRSTSLEICSFVSPYLGVSPKCHLLKTKK